MTLSVHQQVVADADRAAEIEHLALRLLAARDHSRLELKRKLCGRGFDEAAVCRLLDRLLAERVLDEARVAEHYVAERVSKGFGPVRIRGELRGKGVAEELIERYLESVREEWPARLAEVHDRRFGQEPPVDLADSARRARFLQHRGFPTDSIRRFLRWTD